MPDDRIRPNHRRILSLLAGAGSISRAEVAAALDLPKATVTDLVNDLVARGLVVASGPRARPGQAGRPPGMLSLAGPAPAAGVVVWSAGLMRVAVATLDGRVLAEHTTEVDPDSIQDEFFQPAVEVLDDTATRAGYSLAHLAAVVFGVPAPFQRGVGVPVRLPAGEPAGGYFGRLRTDPATALAADVGTHVVVENDANLGALGEYAFGAGRGRHSLVYVKLGVHSVGAGLIVNGWLHRGATGFAGELAHIQVRDDGPLCACGGRGCLIQVIGSGLIDLVQPAYEQPLTYARMLALAAAGDTGMRRIMADLGRGIGRPLADLCTMLNPEAIIVDGAVGEAGLPIIEGIREAVTRHAAPVAADAVRIVPGETGTRADILGAVALARHEFTPRAPN